MSATCLHQMHETQLLRQLRHNQWLDYVLILRNSDLEEDCGEKWEIKSKEIYCKETVILYNSSQDKALCAVNESALALDHYDDASSRFSFEVTMYGAVCEKETIRVTGNVATFLHVDTGRYLTWSNNTFCLKLYENDDLTESLEDPRFIFLIYDPEQKRPLYDTSLAAVRTSIEAVPMYLGVNGNDVVPTRVDSPDNVEFDGTDASTIHQNESITWNLYLHSGNTPVMCPNARCSA